jgi:uncharacterized protein (DUF362 family)
MGWDTITRSLDVHVADLNQGPHVDMQPGLPISRLFLGADMVVNLTKAKTHRRFGVSLAEKSLLGVLCGNRTGYPADVSSDLLDHRRLGWHRGGGASCRRRGV